MVKWMSKETTDPGENTTAEGALPHDCLAWCSPAWHVDVQDKESIRCLRVVQVKAIHQAALMIDWSLSDGTTNKNRIKAALKNGLQQTCNRRRNSTRVIGYRHLKIKLDPAVSYLTLKPVVQFDASGLTPVPCFHMPAQTGTPC